MKDFTAALPQQRAGAGTCSAPCPGQQQHIGESTKLSGEKNPAFKLPQQLNWARLAKAACLQSLASVRATAAHRECVYTQEDSTSLASPFYSNFQDFTQVKIKKEALQRAQSSPGRPKDAVNSCSALGHPREGQSAASQPISASKRNPTREAELPRRRVKCGGIPISHSRASPGLCGSYLLHLGGETQRGLALTASAWGRTFFPTILCGVWGLAGVWKHNG